MLDLSKQRIADILHAGRHYRLSFHRISDADWRGYYERVTSTQERSGKDVINEFDNSAAKIWLVENTLASIDGYDLGTDDAAAFYAQAGWQQLVPLKHKLAAADFLMTVAVEQPRQGDSAIALSAEQCVTLTLPRGWTCDGDGKSTLVSDLKHYFRQPSIDQQRRFRLAQSRSIVESGGRTGKTRNVMYQPVAMQIYNELIVRVEGYIRGELEAMDGLHKVAAVIELLREEVPQEDAE